MMVHFKKKQKDIMYDTPVIFFDKPDKSVLSEVEQMIEDTKYQGNYWDRVYLYQKSEKMARKEAKKLEKEGWKTIVYSGVG